MKKNISKTWKFINSMEKARPFYSEMPTQMWLSNFAPPLFVSYLKYLQHSNADITDAAIVTEANVFVNEYICKQEQSSVYKRMIGLLYQYDEVMKSFFDTSGKEQYTLVYNTAFTAFLFLLFNLDDSNKEAASKIVDILDDLKDSPSKEYTANEQWFPAFVGFISTFIKIIIPSINGKSKYDKDFTQCYLVGFAIFLATYFVKHSVPTEFAFAHNGNRCYITEDFVVSLIRNICENDDEHKWCYSGWVNSKKFLEEYNVYSKVCVAIFTQLLGGNLESIKEACRVTTICVKGISLIVEYDNDHNLCIGTNETVDVALEIIKHQ